MSPTTTCPVCDWKIEKPVSVRTPGGIVQVCCEQCAQTLREKAAKPATKERRRG